MLFCEILSTKILAAILCGKKYQPDDLFPLSAFNKPDTKALRALILKYLPERDNIFESGVKHQNPYNYSL
jgi:hypothetical protein